MVRKQQSETMRMYWLKNRKHGYLVQLTTLQQSMHINNNKLFWKQSNIQCG